MRGMTPEIGLYKAVGYQQGIAFRQTEPHVAVGGEIAQDGGRKLHDRSVM